MSGDPEDRVGIDFRESAEASQALESSSLYISLLSGVQFLLGIGLQVVIGYMFGARRQMDEYLIAVAIPQMIQIVVSPALAVSVVPTWMRWEKKGVEREALGAGLMASLAMAASVALLVVGLADHLPILLAPGLARMGDFILAGYLMAALAMTVIPQTVVALLVASAVARRRYALWPVVGTIGIAIQLAVTWFGAPHYGIVALAAGYLLSASAQLILLLPYFPGGVSRWFAGLPHLASLVSAFYPVALKGTVTRFTIISDRWIASWIGPGAISQVIYGTRLAQALTTVMSSGVGTTVLPKLSRLARSDSTKLEETVIDGVRIMAFLTLPVAAVLLLWGEPLVRLIYGRGAFTLLDATATASVLRCASGWFAFSTLGLAVIMALYALEQHRAVSLISGVTAVLNLGLAFTLARLVGVWGIPLAFSITAGLNLAAFVWLLWKLRGRFLLTPWRSLRDPNLMSLAAVTVFLIVMRPQASRPLPVSGHESLSTLGCLALAGGLYIGLAAVLRSPEVKSLSEAIRGVLAYRPSRSISVENGGEAAHEKH